MSFLPKPTMSPEEVEQWHIDNIREAFNRLHIFVDEEESKKAGHMVIKMDPERTIDYLKAFQTFTINRAIFGQIVQITDMLHTIAAAKKNLNENTFRHFIDSFIANKIPILQKDIAVLEQNLKILEQEMSQQAPEKS